MESRERQILETYESQPRQLSQEYLGKIQWNEVKQFPLDEKFFRILRYFRDIETLTEMYHKELSHTPTGRDPFIRRFMDRWKTEEALHGELLNRFLGEMGMDDGLDWKKKVRDAVPASYHWATTISLMIGNFIGKQFTAVHMTFGTVHELSTLQGYRRLWEQAQHPILEYLLRGIAAEEAIHILFYRSIAKLKLEQSKNAQRMSRYIIDHFWSPVGQGSRPASETNFVIGSLFQGPEGVVAADEYINKQIERLPGFENFTRVRDRIGEIALEHTRYISPGSGLTPSIQ